MPLTMAPGLLLLLLLASGARGALVVSVPTSRVQAQPGSDVLLGCHFSMGGAVDLMELVVQWKLGNSLVAEFDNVPLYPRAGASLSLEWLRVGNASLLLPRVGDTDAGLYTCIVIVPPNRESRQVELCVEAPPHVSVRGTEVRVGEQNHVICSVSNFYPGSVSVAWLRDGLIVAGSKTPPGQLGPTGLYSTTSILPLVPSIPDASANYSCHVQHVALEAPIQAAFRLSVFSPPRLTLLQPLVTLEGQVTLQCLVSGYHPAEIRVQWLRDGVPLLTMESPPTKEPNGSFALRSSCILDRPESNAQANFACRVQHLALATPLEHTAVWRVPACPKSWTWTWVGTMLLLLLLLAWVVCQCCNISMSEIRQGQCWLEGSITVLWCEVEGRLQATDHLAWARLCLEKESGWPGELSAPMQKWESDQHQVLTWRCPLRLGRERLMSCLIVCPAGSSEDTFACTFQPGTAGRQVQQRLITVSSVQGVTPDMDLSSCL
ncbi:limbic system-associated membrane protein-like [Dermochelys coriacea]|uniref:limbic system-associated membrane protein-like n=1 Tax=Dermochelys coriacea TaxID=27794 RepID=UPI001CA88E8E|nr:limbic system-associated membrane protein-like [Dermochelys coriacea]